jgi:hypothetical protein
MNLKRKKRNKLRFAHFLLDVLIYSNCYKVFMSHVLLTQLEQTVPEFMTLNVAFIPSSLVLSFFSDWIIGFDRFTTLLYKDVLLIMIKFYCLISYFDLGNYITYHLYRLYAPISLKCLVLTFGNFLCGHVKPMILIVIVTSYCANPHGNHWVVVCGMNSVSPRSLA